MEHLVRPPAPPELDFLRTVLSKVVNTEIVPQLIMSDRSTLKAIAPQGRTGNRTQGTADGATAVRPGDLKPTMSERMQFEVIVLYRDTFDCFNFVNELRCRGVSLPDVYVGLFQPVARELGRRWSEDSLSFMEVTKAIGQMQTMVRALGAADPPAHPIDAAHRIVLASAPEEQHSLGMLVVSQLFESEGWEVEGGNQLSVGKPLNDLVHDQWFGVVGLSASTEHGARQLKSAIDELRKASMNESISVIVGGNGFIDHPDISSEIGADEVAGDANDAVAKAEQLLSRSKSPSRP